jgi:hypothetical protein
VHQRRVSVVAGAAIMLGALVAAAPAPAAFPGANGRIAFQGANSLGTINSVGGDRRPLISQAGAVFATPAWSADGQRLAFATNRDGNFEIYTTGTEGVPLTRVTTNAADDGSPAWSPDGSRIVFESDREGGHHEIFVMNADGTGVMRLTSSVLESRAPAWSPNGRSIAFARGVVGGNLDIWTMTAEGGSPTPLTNNAAHEDNPDWSPDGSRIAFQRDGSIVLMGADGGGQAPLPLPGGGSRPTWSPDGSKIAFDLDLELFAANTDGSGVTPLTTAGSPALIAQSATWQPVPPPSGGGPPPPPPAGSLDADGDGVLRPADCRDDDPRIHPGARDVPGDGVDQDCNGRDARFPLLARTVTAFTLTYPAGYTVFTSMLVKPARKGDRLRLTCRGRGCPLATKSVRVKKNARSLSLLRHLRGERLRKGAVVQLRVTRPGTVGRMYTWVIRAPKRPLYTRRCLRPGARRPSACPR